MFALRIGSFMKAYTYTYASHTLSCLMPSSFFMGIASILRCEGQDSWAHKMARGSDYAVLLDRLSEAVRVAPRATPDIVSQIIAGACNRIPLLGAKATKIGQLIKLGSWFDAAAALIELELPGWKLRRLIREDGEWFCSLSQQPNLPVMLDDTADGTHEDLPLAILLAFLEARRRMSLAAPPVARAVPTVDLVPVALTSCDNFA